MSVVSKPHGLWSSAAAVRMDQDMASGGSGGAFLFYSEAHFQLITKVLLSPFSDQNTVDSGG